MARSLSLTAYMAYARRSSDTPAQFDTPRPTGELVWAHAADDTRARALYQIAERLHQLRPGARVLVSAGSGVDLSGTACEFVLAQDLPEESIAAIDAFLDHWRPDICLWTGGDLRPALLTCADRRDIPLYLIDADEAQLSRSSWRWFPDLPRSVLRRFAQIQARSKNAARMLRRIGVAEADISITGALRPEAVPLPYREDERAELAALLRGRPLWQAARLEFAELEIVLQARQAVSRLSHRSVLIVTPEHPGELPAFEERIASEGLRMAVWANGDLPEETTQVILGEAAAELGLWYRLAPISLMGGSLLPGLTGHDPNEAAVHGTAILYGPHLRHYLSEYTRYAEAGAARIVRDADTLAAAVQSLLAPDQAAAMTHAAWDVASQGAPVTDRVLDLVQDTLDVMGAG